MIVIGNKLDLLEHSEKFKMKRCIDENELLAISNNKWDFIKISCYTEENIDDLWNILAKKSKLNKLKY